jgi:hypothetical protein
MAIRKICCCVKKYKEDDERLDDGTCVCYPHFIGNGILICGKRASRFPLQLFIGPDWCCMLLTYLLICGPSVLFLMNVGRQIGVVFIVIGSITFLGTIW